MAINSLVQTGTCCGAENSDSLLVQGPKSSTSLTRVLVPSVSVQKNVISFCQYIPRPEPSINAIHLVSSFKHSGTALAVKETKQLELGLYL